MAHSPEEQHYLLTRDRIRDGELPFLKSAFEGDGWLKIYNNNETYLMMSCYYRQSSVIEFLLSKATEHSDQTRVKEWLKVVSPNENTPLHNYLCGSAVAYRRKQRHAGLPILTSIIEKLIAIGFGVNERNSYGETPLFLAGTSNDLLAVETLVRLGADVNAQCCVLQETVLHQACLAKQHDMLETILSVKDVDVNQPNMHGWSPLHLAAQQDDSYKVKRLLESGASLTATSSRGDTPLFFSLQKVVGDPGHSSFEVLFNWLHKNMSPEQIRAHFKHVNKKGECLLDCTVKHQNYVALKILLEMEDDIFDINTKDAMGRSLLHLSVIHAPNKNILEYLIERGLSPDAQDNLGNTPIMYFFKQIRIIPHNMPPAQQAQTPNVNV